MNRYVLIGIVILAIIGTIFWFFWPKSQKKVPRTPAQFVQSPPTASYEVQPRKMRSEQRSFHFFDIIAPLIKPFEVLIPNNSPTSFSDNPSQPPLTLRGGDDDVSPLSLRGARGVTEKPLPSSDPTFKKLYPDYYLSALQALHRMMKNDGFLSSGSLFAIANENDLFSFLETLITYAETKQYIKQTDATRFRIALHGEVKKILHRERFQYERTRSLRPFLYSLFTFLRTKTALADVVTSPDCYADRNPTNPIPGVNVPWPLCCNCGLTCPDLDFVDDCGPDGDDCDIQLGCLNLICPNGNAIWDPVTGICGCDDVSGAVDAATGVVDIVIDCS